MTFRVRFQFVIIMIIITIIIIIVIIIIISKTNQIIKKQKIKNLKKDKT